MKSLLEKILPQFIVDFYKTCKNKYTTEKVRKNWELAGKPFPPPHIIKQQAIQYYQKKSGYNILVETGTYKGDMILAQKNFFKKIYSVELSQVLFEKAKKRFRSQKDIILVQGNSGDALPGILTGLKEPAIFWLDGHYSGGITASIEKYSPVREELQAIIANNQMQHIILIDDAHVFDGNNGYPTIEETKELTTSQLPDYHFSVDENIIRLVPLKFSK